MALWTRNLKSRWPLGSASSEGTRRASFVCSSYCSGHPWPSAASFQSLTLSSHVSFSLLSLLSLILYLIRYLSLDSSLPSYSRILSTWDLFSKHSHIQSFLRSGHTHTLQEGTSYDPLQLVSLLYSQSGKSPIIHTHYIRFPKNLVCLTFCKSSQMMPTLKASLT